MKCRSISSYVAKGDYRDARLVPLRKEGIALLKKHGAVSHRFGYYHSGPYAGQILVVVGYPDIAIQESALKSMQEDPAWMRVAAEVQILAPLQESFVAVVTEEQ